MALNFKNTFGVFGPRELVDKFKQEAIDFGWTFISKWDPTDNKGLFFRGVVMPTTRFIVSFNEFCCSNISPKDSSLSNTFDLTTKWEEAIRFMKEYDILVIKSNKNKKEFSSEEFSKIMSEYFSGPQKIK